MTETDRKSFAEVEAVILSMPSRLKDKIPLKIREMLSDNKTPEYVVSGWNEQQLSGQAKAILSLIYRKYLKDMQIDENPQNTDNLLLKEPERVILGEKTQLQVYEKTGFYDKLMMFL